MHKILIIEDDAAISNLIKSALTREGYSCEIASDGLIGEQMFDSGSWDLVLLHAICICRSIHIMYARHTKECYLN